MGEAGVVLLGAFAGGFVSGLAGFGTGLVALGIWLHVIDPRAAASLVVICSVVAQAQTIPPSCTRSIRRDSGLSFSAASSACPLEPSFCPR